MNESDIALLSEAMQRHDTKDAQDAHGACCVLSADAEHVTALSLETDRNQGLKMLSALEDAGLLKLLSTESKKVKSMSRPDKIYCDNTNLMHTLQPASDVGTERETFFLNQLSIVHDVTYPTKGDFLVDGKFLFEVGGAGKGFSQIADISDSYVVNDDVEIGFGSKIPLWLFGFLY